MYKVHIKICTLVLISLLQLCSGLYEDQVGKFDWKLSYIGKAKFAQFSGKRVYVATDQNVIAALQTSNGQIAWRQTLENPNEQQIQLFHIEKDLVTVSGGTNSWFVRGWDLITGTLTWEWTIPINHNYEVRWAISKDKLIHIVPVIGTNLEITVYQLQTGQIAKVAKKIPTPWVTNLNNCVLAQTYFLCLSANDANGQIYFINTVSEDEKVVTRALESLIGDVPGRVQLEQYTHPKPAVILTRNNAARLVLIEDESVVVLPYIISPNSEVVSNGDQTILLQLEINPDNPEKLLRVVSHDLDDVEKQTSVDIKYPLGLGAPYPAAAQCRGSTCELLLSSSDHALTLVRLPEGKIMWTREEALSHIVAVEFLELPVSDMDASIESEFQTSGDILSMLYRRLLSQIKQLSTLFFDNPLLSSANGLVRDEFGLHKLIVVATSAGKLFALDTLSGTIVWSYRLPNVKPFSVLGEAKMYIFVQRTARYAPFAAHCMLLARDARTDNGIIFRFDPISGHSKTGIERLDYRIKQAMLLPHEDEKHVKGVLVLSESREVFIYPASAKEIVEQHAASMYLYEADSTLGILQGYSVKASPTGSFVVNPTWNISLGESRLVSVSTRPPSERVHSQGRVLPDRSVYYKYVNPNMIAIAAVSEDSVHKNVLSIYLIDGVTGLILYSANHKRAREPVRLVHSENWLVYSYFSERYRRTEVAAVELYEGFVQNNSSHFSSFAVSQLPHAEAQAYILPVAPLAMTSTLTERGITTKFLLIALSNGVVAEIPWLMVQPRLPDVACGPEESCIPYMPEIPIVPQASVNYNQTLERVREINVAPARLESNCHVLVHGLDLFYTRVAPSKTFDVLKEDFDHRLIVLVLTGLIVASYVAKRLASRKALKQAWK